MSGLLRRHCMQVFHYVATLTMGMPLFTSPTTYFEEGDAGAIYNDTDFDPASLLHEEYIQSTMAVLVPHMDPIEAVDIESNIIDQVYLSPFAHVTNSEEAQMYCASAHVRTQAHAHAHAHAHVLCCRSNVYVGCVHTFTLFTIN